DPMYDVYLYPLGGGNITATVRELPAGSYDVYLYGHGGPGVDTQNSVFQVVSGNDNYGTKATTTNSDWSSAVWQEGRQYVVFRDVRVVNGGDALTVTVLPGASGYAIINGMQFELLAQSNPTNSSCVSAPSGLISWWRGEGNVLDGVGGNNGTLRSNVTYAAGEVGQALSLDGVSDGVVIGNPANLQLKDFTIEAWIKRASSTKSTSGPYHGAAIFAYSTGGYGLTIADDGHL